MPVIITPAVRAVALGSAAAADEVSWAPATVIRTSVAVSDSLAW